MANLFGKKGESVVTSILLKIAFPYGYDLPAHCLQRLDGQFVTPDVVMDLSLPELSVGLGTRGIAAADVPMPETAVDEDASVILRKHNIRTARQLLHMDAVTESGSVEILTHKYLGPRVLGPDMRHAIVPLLRCHRVRHGDGAT